MRRIFLTILSLLVLASCLRSVAIAQPVKLGHSGHGKRVTLTVNYQSVAVLNPRSGASASDRAAKAISRLQGLAKSGRSPHFTSGRGSGGWCVLADGGVVVVAGPADAKAAGVKRRTVARRWASAFARAWTTPLLRLGTAEIVVPVGASRSVSLGGVGRGPVKLSGGSSSALTARYAGRSVSLKGRAPGSGSLTVWRDGATQTLDFRVMKYAGSVRPVTLEVTGTAVPREIIQTLVRSEAAKGIRLEQGAWSTIEHPPVLPQMWTHGKTYRAYLGIRITGPGYLPVETRVPLNVVRRRLAPEKRVVLFYSNDPETVNGPQLLFRHAVANGVPARLLYHHQNASSRSLDVCVDLHNDGDKAARVQVVDGSADACVDTVMAGHMAAMKFLKRTRAGAGLILDMPPHSVRRLASRNMQTNETASGLMMVRPISGRSLTLCTVAESPGARPPSQGAAHDTDSVFPSPDQIVNATYSVGGSWTYVTLGQKAVSNGSGKTLDGNYGVLYTVNLRLDNPTTIRRTVSVLFEARAGEARAAMIVDGAVRETSRVIPPEEERIASISLAPHQVRTLTVVTIPAGGGSYPAALVVHG